MKKALFVFILLPKLLFSSEGYNHKALVDTIEKEGFYKILLVPDVISVLQANYADIRIYDSKNNEIPYLFVEEKPVTMRSYFKELEILENTPVFKPKVSRIIVHNKNKRIFSELLFIMRNSDAEREITIKGSENKENWYFISASYPTREMELKDETSEIRSLTFPKSNYEYFELTIKNSKFEPLQILKVGYNDSEMAKGLYTELPGPKIQQKDTMKKSIVTVIFDRPYEFSKLEWIVSGPELYRRTCKFGEFGEYRKYGTNGYFEDYELSSRVSPVWSFDKKKADTLILIIENADNVPLKIEGLKAYQLNKYLVTKLIPDENYRIFFGNAKETSPEYDLKYFADLIPGQLPIIQTQNIETISGDQIKPMVKPKTFFNKTVMWVIILVVALGLGILSIRLVKEMGNK